MARRLFRIFARYSFPSQFALNKMLAPRSEPHPALRPAGGESFIIQEVLGPESVNGLFYGVLSESRTAKLSAQLLFAAWAGCEDPVGTCEDLLSAGFGVHRTWLEILPGLVSIGTGDIVILGVSRLMRGAYRILQFQRYPRILSEIVSCVLSTLPEFVVTVREKCPRLLDEA